MLSERCQHLAGQHLKLSANSTTQQHQISLTDFITGTEESFRKYLGVYFGFRQAGTSALIIMFIC